MLLSSREQLLILDGFDHLLDGRYLVQELLQRAPRLKILVTSREKLNLHEEKVIRVEGLEVSADPPLGIDDHASAIHLFLERIQRVQRWSTVSPENLQDIVSICRLVDGNPLAIELAAGWVDRLTPAEIAQAIEEDFDFLKTTLRDVPARHRSMRAVFEDSWQVLSSRERHVLRQLSIFAAAFSKEDVLTNTEATLEDVRLLEQKSLVQRITPNTYVLYKWVRAYALRTND